jgi:hypothetical protein
MDKFELWQLPSFHFWPRWWVLRVQGCARPPQLEGENKRHNRVGLEGNFFSWYLSSFSWYCAGGPSDPRIIYTGHVDRIEKASSDYDKDIPALPPTLLNQTVQREPDVFAFTQLSEGTNCMLRLGMGLLARPCRDDQAILLVDRGTCQAQRW